MQSGISSSEALRQLISKILTGRTALDKVLNIPQGVLPKPENGLPKNRIEIRLTNKEHLKLAEHAKKSGFSPTKWLVTLVRYQFIKHTPLTVLELDKLDERLYQIRMIGQNLNQITRALNSHELSSSQVDVMPMLQELLKVLDEDRKALKTIASHNLDRW
ncbi:MAG: plasmid mobilization relaxosome protein MobC [Methylotenera sp.]|nr:plasmid mobilization relaxosome protein MobC [Methylotenera sp.]